MKLLPGSPTLVSNASCVPVSDKAAEQPPAPGSPPKVLRISPVDSGKGLRSIDTDTFVFGRDESCDLVVAETLASRRHAKIVRDGENWFVVDLGSTNGTFVNDVRVDSQQLYSGDCLRVGRWTFKFFDADNIEAHYYESVYRMMTQDALTGSWNRRYLMDVLERELHRHARSKQPVGLLMIDFDHFKSINDRYGHLVGDEVLAEFGRRVKAVTRNSEVFARFGGDEFAVVLVNTDFESALKATERLREAAIGDPFFTSSGILECSLSCGIAVCDAGNSLTREELLDAADKNLFKAKNAGRNQAIG
ncbi:diguanylate cyclase [Mariniblastus fucicola]|uniref:diguanylate cyclase n=1 Tax=Mariniblastus fucicola TaxID=980251 RepID=A0A5B9P785_9BACT|nr:GGDEF domain-containing protein [Mariniblastus fucicola]QEG20810.1 Response regulator PleD [Mariniblastus fucicola]